MRFNAFGLSLAADGPIPGLIPQSLPAEADIRIWLHQRSAPSQPDGLVEEPYYVSEDAGADGPALRVWRTADGSRFRLRYADDTQFIVAGTGEDVRAVSPAGSTLEDTATYLLGPVLGFAMRLRGMTCLHASVVAVDGQAAAIAGPAGAGKSTAAACFSAMGHAVLSDDIAALAEHDGRVYVHPAYPQLRLWPDSVAMLFGAADALPPLTPTWDKRALALTGRGAFQQEPLPLRVVYVLTDQQDFAETAIADVTGAERLKILLANSYVGYLLDRNRRRQEFESLARLALAVHVRRVIRPAGADGMARLCARLVEDCERLGCTASPVMGG